MPDIEQQSPAEEPKPPAPEARRRRRAPRWLLYTLAVVTAIAAGLFVTLFTIDLGPHLKARAEREASRWLDRKMTIGRVSALLRPGQFAFDDVVIEGRNPGDRPFLRAKRITVSIPWWTLINKRLVFESIDLTDWDMVIETFPGGRHNFPRVMGPPRDPARPKSPRWFNTTLRQVLATRGRVTYIDHSTPWRIEAPNMRVMVFRRDFRGDYGGTASFGEGRVKIQTYEEFGARMQSRFSIQGSRLHWDRIDLVTDGARSVLDGDLQMDRWPEQIYRIRSEIDIATQKQIFFNKDRFTASGRADFTGTFHYFRGSRELAGTWSTPLAHVKIGANNWRFEHLQGGALWLPSRLEITDAKTRLYGGTATFQYRILSLDQKNGPKRAEWDVSYDNVDLVQLTDFLETEGIRLAGRATGYNRLRWPIGRWADLRGEGEVVVAPPAGIATAGRTLTPEQIAAQVALPEPAGPFNPAAPLGYVPIAGHLTYRLDPRWITLARSWVATPKTYVEFDGRTAYYQASQIPFRVTSLDWQEADRVFAGILTAFGSPTRAFPIGGYGEFEGVMTGPFNDPRIEGRFTGENMRAWDVNWGRTTADVVVEDSYAHVSRSSLISGDSEINATGKFSLGYPRRDRGEEVNARVTMRRRRMEDLRHAFELDDWPVDGLVSGEYVLSGNYETPVGTGTLLIENGVAYGEPFERATSTLRFEGTGVRLEKFEVHKSTGRVTGSAWVGWDGNYSFSADGQRIPVESLKMLEYPTAPLSGLLWIDRASGSGSFENPSYDIWLRVVDLFAGDEGIGQLTGHLGLRGELLSLDFEAASPRLAVSGAGRVAMNDEMDAELTLRFTNTSLDPYVRFFEPRLSPFTRAVAGGTVRVSGELMNVDQLVVDARVESLEATLFDYQLANDGPIELVLNRHVAEIGRLKLRGEGTNLEVTGDVSLHDRTISLAATGDANLGILQGFFRNLRSSGTARLSAGVTGSFDRPVFSGEAVITDGRLRNFQMPRSLEGINGAITFDASGIRLDSPDPTRQLTARFGGGRVTFGGRIAMTGFVPGELSLTASGERMNLNYPEGFRSEIDADLALRGTLELPILTGNVTVRTARYDRRFETMPNVFDFGGGSTVPLGAAPSTTTFPLRFDIQIDAPNTLQIDNNVARMTANADLRLQGTYDRPILTGRAEIVRGDLAFEGNRYRVTRGTIDFANPQRIEPYFDVEAETQVRVGDQTYRVTVGLVGTTSRMLPTLISDPPLPTADILAVLFGQAPDLTNAELRSLSAANANQSEADLLRELSYRILSAPISAPVTQAVEGVLGAGTTVQITPLLNTETDALAPSARLVIGRRLSSRVYLTFARALGNATREQIIVLEYDQSDRISWVITQNGDRTFAIDVRVRHVF